MSADNDVVDVQSDTERFHQLFSDGCDAIYRVGAMLRALRVVMSTPEIDDDIDTDALINAIVDAHVAAEAMMNWLPMPGELAKMRAEQRAEASSRLARVRDEVAIRESRDAREERNPVPKVKAGDRTAKAMAKKPAKVRK